MDNQQRDVATGRRSVEPFSRRRALELQKHQSVDELLERYLAILGLSQADFAEKIGVHQPAVSQWLRGARIPTRSNIFAIARLFDDRIREEGNRKGVMFDGEDMGTVLVSLLNASGMGVDERPRNVQWTALLEKRDLIVHGIRGEERLPDLKFGWTESSPLAGSEPKGKIAIEIAARCSRLMGFRGQMNAYSDWELLLGALRNRVVDAVVPILARSPHYPQDVALSEPIGLLLPHMLVVLKMRPQLSIRPDNSHFMFLNVRTGTGAYAFGADSVTGSESRSFESADDALDYLLENQPKERHKILAVVCDPLVAQGFVDKRTDIETVKPPPIFDIAFPLCFGVREDEPRLLADINLAVDAMRRSGMLRSLFKEREGDLKGYPIEDTLPRRADWVNTTDLGLSA